MWNIYIFIIALFIVNSKTSAVSFNQPKFCPTATWNPHGITLANASIVGSHPSSIFVNTNNTIYVTNRQDKIILVWDEGSINPTKIISNNFTYLNSLFVTSNGDIYIHDGIRNGRVLKWIAKTNTFVTVMNVNSPCDGLFVDTNDTLYCSTSGRHQVVKRSLNDPNMTSIIVAAGTGFSGSASNELNRPLGIFVDVNLDLYVADCGNDRVQLFQSGELNGITVAGYGSPNPTISLNCPTGIILDAEKNLFIVDSLNRRIVGSSLNGFRCLVGCSGQGGSQSNQLFDPMSLSFDRSGNMFVTDGGNNRIQKFEYLESCMAVSFNQPKFCPTASWNPNGITLANASIISSYPSSIFVNTNNTIYVTNGQDNIILVWDEGSNNPTKIISGNLTYPNSLFVTSNGDIYIHDGIRNGRVQKWIAKTNTFVTVMNVNSTCESLFVDTHDTLYCSMSGRHQVVKRSLNDPDMTSIVVAAGTGSPGSAFNELNRPSGIFVDVNLDLYVADCGNHRVQLFRSGESNGITVAGSTSPNPTIILNCPDGIVLDAEKNLFIVDDNNHRIVGSSSNGFRCLIGCSGQGSQSHQLFSPMSLSFDRSGNIFVVDYGNNRIQKFEYLEKSCVYSSLVPQNMYSSSLSTSNQIYNRNCDKQNFYYEAIQVKVNTSGYYSFLSDSTMDAYGFLYRNTFDPLNPIENLLQAEDDGGSDSQFRLNIHLSGNMTYVLVMTTYQSKETGTFSITVLGTNQVILERLSTPVNIQLVYSSELTVNSLTYDQGLELVKYYYEAFEMNVVTKDVYVLWSESNIDTYGYIYKNDFNPLKPSENLLLKHDGYCNDGQLKLIADLEINTRYILVVTTNRPNTIGNFSVFISGPDSVGLNHWRGNVSNVDTTTNSNVDTTTNSNGGMTINPNALLYIFFLFRLLELWK